MRTEVIFTLMIDHLKTKASQHSFIALSSGPPTESVGQCTQFTVTVHISPDELRAMILLHDVLISWDRTITAITKYNSRSRNHSLHLTSIRNNSVHILNNTRSQLLLQIQFKIGNGPMVQINTT